MGDFNAVRQKFAATAASAISGSGSSPSSQSTTAAASTATDALGAPTVSSTYVIAATRLRPKQQQQQQQGVVSVSRLSRLFESIPSASASASGLASAPTVPNTLHHHARSTSTPVSSSLSKPRPAPKPQNLRATPVAATSSSTTTTTANATATATSPVSSSSAAANMMMHTSKSVDQLLQRHPRTAVVTPKMMVANDPFSDVNETTPLAPSSSVSSRISAFQGLIVSTSTTGRSMIPQSRSTSPSKTSSSYSSSISMPRPISSSSSQSSPVKPSRSSSITVVSYQPPPLPQHSHSSSSPSSHQQHHNSQQHSATSSSTTTTSPSAPSSSDYRSPSFIPTAPRRYSIHRPGSLSTSSSPSTSPSYPPVPARPPSRVITAPVSQPQLLSPTITTTVTSSSSAADTHDDTKRTKVIQELIETEATFKKDMLVLKEIYYEPASKMKLFTKTELKILFANLDIVIQTSTMLSYQFQQDATYHLRIGKIFLEQILHIEQTYCEYCKHNDTAIAKSAEFTSPDGPPEIKEFLADCQKKLQGRTGAWDFSSLIIKPVQRVLKYPLLLKQLLKETNSNHPDYNNLTEASSEMDSVAEKINDVKKRIDIVEKYIDGKGGSNVIHGLNKKITRGAQQLKMATGINESTIDAQYEEIEDGFLTVSKKAGKLREDILLWASSLGDMILRHTSVVNLFEELFDNSGANISHLKPSCSDSNNIPPILNLLFDYLHALQQVADKWKLTLTRIHDSVLPLFDELFATFKGPHLLMKKRDKKLLDFDRSKSLRIKGEEVDKLLQASVEQYEALNAQLIEELPKLVRLVGEYIQAIVSVFASCQMQVYSDLSSTFAQIAHNLNDGVVDEWTSGHVIARYIQSTMENEALESAVRQVKLLAKFYAVCWPELVHKEREHEVDYQRNTMDVLSGGGFLSRTPPPLSSSSTSSSPTKDYTPSQTTYSSNRIIPSTTSTHQHPHTITDDPFSYKGRIAIALYSFTAEFEEEMTINERDTLVIDESAPERPGWIYATNPYNNQEGYIPENYIEH